MLGSRTNPTTPSGVASSGGQQKSRVADCRGARALLTGVTAAAAAAPIMVRVVKMTEVLETGDNVD